MTSSPIPAARSQYILDLLAQLPDPRKRRSRRHPPRDEGIGPAVHRSFGQDPPDSTSLITVPLSASHYQHGIRLADDHRIPRSLQACSPCLAIQCHFVAI
jgi:hypothetical protein